MVPVQKGCAILLAQQKSLSDSRRQVCQPSLCSQQLEELSFLSLSWGMTTYSLLFSLDSVKAADSVWSSVAHIDNLPTEVFRKTEIPLITKGTFKAHFWFCLSEEDPWGVTSVVHPIPHGFFLVPNNITVETERHSVMRAVYRKMLIIVMWKRDLKRIWNSFGVCICLGGEACAGLSGERQ